MHFQVHLETPNTYGYEKDLLPNLGAFKLQKIVKLYIQQMAFKTKDKNETAQVLYLEYLMLNFSSLGSCLDSGGGGVTPVIRFLPCGRGLD